jgi:predicted PurR-regulated permease PerM
MNKLENLLKTGTILIIVFLLVFGIIQAKLFLYPIVFALLIAYLLYPLANFLEKKHFPRILAILSSIFLALLIVIIVFSFLYMKLTNMFDDSIALNKVANENIESLLNYINNTFGIENKRIEDFLKQIVNQFFSAAGGGFNKVFSATAGTIFRILILPVYVFLFLFYRTKFAYFILKIAGKKNKANTIKILRDISTVAPHYLGGVAIVVLILCLLNSLGLYIIGVKYFILLGIISAFFNFIPYFGTLMGGAVPLLFVLLATEEPLTYAFRVVILFIIIQFTENNILTPNIVGGYVKINPFFVIIGLVFGALVWGIPGMIVIVPVLAVARIIFKNEPSLEPYAFLLGPSGTKQHAIHIPTIKQILSVIKNKK